MIKEVAQFQIYITTHCLQVWSDLQDSSPFITTI